MLNRRCRPDLIDRILADDRAEFGYQFDSVRSGSHLLRIRILFCKNRIYPPRLKSGIRFLSRRISSV